MQVAPGLEGDWGLIVRASLNSLGLTELPLQRGAYRPGSPPEQKLCVLMKLNV